MGETVTAQQLSCVAVLGDPSSIVDRLRELPGQVIDIIDCLIGPDTQVVMVARLETVLHVNYGSNRYWEVRRRWGRLQEANVYTL